MNMASVPDPNLLRPGSVGLVAAQKVVIEEPLTLACGVVLDRYELVYETYGQLNGAGTNAVLICHALSGHHHAAGYYTDDPGEKPGWWETCIGPGKPIDTDRFFVVVPNNIGGCHGSTGPATVNDDTGKPWGSDFPQLRVRDWVESQRQLSDYLGIDCWAAIVGPSLGGMQAMRWSLMHPHRVKHALVIASAMALTPTNIAFDELARAAIRSDPDFCDGDYLAQGKTPEAGLALARMIAHVTYQSDTGFVKRFGRDLASGTLDLGDEHEVQFQIASYLNYKGKQFVNRFDANSYILITRMLDLFDLAREYDQDPVKAFQQAQCKFFVVSFTSDWRFPPSRSKEIVEALIAAGRDLSYIDIETSNGHDAFLMSESRYIDAFSAYMSRVADDLQRDV